jgi:hypothetical protein
MKNTIIKFFFITDRAANKPERLPLASTNLSGTTTLAYFPTATAVKNVLKICLSSKIG